LASRIKIASILNMKTKKNLAWLGIIHFLLINALGREVFVTGFEEKEARQKTPVWCWAACIQMVYAAQDVSLSQEQIVTAIKGRLVAEAGSNREIVDALNAVGFTQEGNFYSSVSVFHPGAPYIPGLIKELEEDRPLIVSYVSGPNSSHVVIIYRAKYQQTPLGPVITSVTLFDPYTGGSQVVAGVGVASTVTGTWYASVKKSGKGRAVTKEPDAKSCEDCHGKGYTLEKETCPVDDCIAGDIDCSRCRGTGDIERTDGTMRDCLKCKGTGKTKCLRCKGTGEITRREKCETCSGKGRILDDE
jgi:hypothetical protein